LPELDDLVNYAIIVAVAAALILMVTGRFFDLSIDRQSSVQTRATINLLQDIVTEGPFLVTDSAGNKMKLMVDMQKYGSGSSLNLIECCDSVQYDYKFSIGKHAATQQDAESIAELVVQPISDVRSNYVSVDREIQIGDSCYTSFGLGNKITSSVPVSACEAGASGCEPAVAYMETTHTPLSEISYWISQACQSSYDLSKRIPLAASEYASAADLKVDNEQKTVCIVGNCRRFYCDRDIEVLADESMVADIPWSLPPKSCNFASVVREQGEIKIIGRFGGS
jgi:hypothetical protein